MAEDLPAPPLYLDTSVVVRATLESGMTPDVERRLADAPALITSRLSLVEASRAIHRARLDGRTSHEQLARVEAEIEALWARCDLWELSADICQRARTIAAGRRLRTLDALHLATFVAARERIDRLELLTVDARLEEASVALGTSGAR